MKNRIFIIFFLCIFVLCSSGLCRAGRIVSWGRQKTPDSPLKDIQAITTGSSHSLALKADGSIVGWGWNNYGQATPPDGNDFVAISAGHWHNLALKADGSIVGWGWNDVGQATPPDGNDFVAISAGYWHSLAIKEIVPKIIEAEMNFTPKTISCKSKGNWLKAHITLPGDLTADDVDLTEPAVLEPVGIGSEQIQILGSDNGPVMLEITFDRSAFCEPITGSGNLEITVTGSLTDGGYFTATDTIRIKSGR